MVGVDSLADSHPNIAAQWHQARNVLTPAQVTRGSTKKVWWLGPCGHEWDATVANRVGRSSGCPYCTRKKVLTGFNDLTTRYPEIAAQWHPTKNGDRMPETTIDGTPRKAWWLGGCGHDWEAEVRERVRGTSCPYCSGSRVLSGYNDLLLIDPALADQWHPDKNGNLRPSDCAARSTRTVWWLDEHGHEWHARIATRTGGGHGCPYCSGRRPVRGTGDLVTLRPDLAHQWHPTTNGELSPASVSPGSKRNVWWRDEHSHEWKSTVKDRAQGHGCPYCSGRRAIVGKTDLASRRPDIAAEWHPTRNGELRPDQVTFGSSQSIWWACAEGHEWETRVTYRTSAEGTGCPFCFPHWSRGEKEVAAFIASVAPNLTVLENDRSSLGNRTELDISLPELKIGIEYNGVYWHDESDPEVRHRHVAKATAAVGRGITLVIVWEDDWKVRRSAVEDALVAIISGGVGVPPWMTYERTN